MAFEVVRSNPAGSTLIDLAKALSESSDVTIYSSRIDPELEGRVECRHIPVLARGGVLVRLFSFYVAQLPVLLWEKIRGRWAYDIVHTNDSEAFVGDYVTFHNCHADCLNLTMRHHLWAPERTLKGWLNNAALYANFSLRALIERRNVRRARRIYVLTEMQRDLIVKHYRADVRKIEIRPNYIQQHVASRIAAATESRASVRRELQLSMDDVAVVFVAQGGWKRKGLDLLMDAFTRVNDAKLKLLVVGAGGRVEGAFYKRLATRLGIGSRIVWLGHKDNVVSLMRAADIFALPSFYEAFSLVSLEALAVGLPLVMTPVSGAREAVVEGRNGYVVTHDAEALASALRSLLSSADRRREFAEYSRQHALQFESSRCLTRLVDGYWDASSTGVRSLSESVASA